MNTKVTVTSTYKSSDHLIILSDSNKLSGFSSFLNKTELNFLKKAVKKEVPYVSQSYFGLFGRNGSWKLSVFKILQ